MDNYKKYLRFFKNDLHTNILKLQVKTNLDKLARKINYELAFFDDQITS